MNTHCACGRAVPATEFDRVLFRWVAVGAGWICAPCDAAPRCRAEGCDQITARPGEGFCGNCGGEARPS